MTPRHAADRLRRAETEYRAALTEHDGSLRATVRYQAAKRELEVAFDVARAILLDTELRESAASAGSHESRGQKHIADERGRRAMTLGPRLCPLGSS